MFKDENAITFVGQYKEHMKTIAEMIRSRIGQPAAAPSGNSGSTTSIADELKKLADLKTQGILSDEEFEAAKKKLLQ